MIESERREAGKTPQQDGVKSGQVIIYKVPSLLCLPNLFISHPKFKAAVGRTSGADKSEFESQFCPLPTLENSSESLSLFASKSYICEVGECSLRFSVL